MNKLYRLDVDEVFSKISLFTKYDIGGEGHGIIVEEENLNDAICEIVDNFRNVIERSFVSDDETEEEE